MARLGEDQPIHSGMRLGETIAATQSEGIQTRSGIAPIEITAGTRFEVPPTLLVMKPGVIIVVTLRAEQQTRSETVHIEIIKAIRLAAQLTVSAIRDAGSTQQELELAPAFRCRSEAGRLS